MLGSTRPTAAVLGLLAIAGTFCAGGCLSKASRQQMAESDSVLAPLFKKTSPAEAASWAADPYDADKRARGMNLLANAPFGGAEAYLRLYRDRLTDPSPPVRAVAARALGLHGTPEDVPRIIPLMSEESDQVRLEATRAMQRLHNPIAVTPLLQRLDDDVEPDEQIRAEAASALGQYAEARVLQGLIAAVADPSLLVNSMAQSSLQTLTGDTDVPMERKAWVAWMKDTAKPFQYQQKYVYPVFWREKTWLDYVPFSSPVPNEQAGSPVGFQMYNGEGS